MKQSTTPLHTNAKTNHLSKEIACQSVHESFLEIAPHLEPRQIFVGTKWDIFQPSTSGRDEMTLAPELMELAGNNLVG